MVGDRSRVWLEWSKNFVSIHSGHSDPSSTNTLCSCHITQQRSRGSYIRIEIIITSKNSDHTVMYRVDNNLT